MNFKIDEKISGISIKTEKEKDIEKEANDASEPKVSFDLRQKLKTLDEPEIVAKSPDSGEEEESYSSDVSDSTVPYNGGSSESNGKTEMTIKDSNKENFFSSDSDATNSSFSCENDVLTKKKKKKVMVEDEKQEGKKQLEATDAEEKELEKLLRMTEINAVVRAHSDSNEEEEEEEENGEEKEIKKEKQREKKVPKSNQEVSLLDCFDPENPNCDNNLNPDEADESKAKAEFFSFINSQIKKTFLLSSDESMKSSEEVEEKAVGKKEKPEKDKRKKKSNTKKKKKDGLDEFRISDPSSETEDFALEKSKAKDSALKENGDANSVEDSEPFVKNVQQHVTRKKREFANNSDRTTDTDSGSDIQQVVSKTESPVAKGRKNIKKILKKEKLQVETKQALKMEAERKKRVSERKKLFEKLFPNADADSRLILDFDPETKEELVVVDDNLTRQLKPHQKDGIRFMWDSCFESLKRLEEDSGSGCVLAHCMGLGKTLQVVSLVHTILTHNTGVQTVLIMCPLNTIRNWTHEFKTWQSECEKKIQPVDLIPCKNGQSRLSKLKVWSREGGVMIISYEMFRSLVKKSVKNSAYAESFLDPGPDLVVCDEGHVLKNSNSALSKCMSQIKTLRRIILTGTPLQNNLMEYYCMVQFVKPKILGTVKEFRNRFVHPINNGQFEDSTQLDVILMKRRAHVLHTMLDGFIQRFDYYVLTPFLPEKQEYVISVALTETQENIYRLFIERCKQENRGLLKDFHWMGKVWTHPRVLLMYSEKHNLDVATKEMWSKHVQKEEFDEIRSSGKLFLLFSILKRSNQIGDKVLVFSQSLFNLDLIEFFLRKANSDFCSGLRTEFADRWVFGEDYFRLEGSTSSENRDAYCRKFNDVSNKQSRLFLVSTKAGGLGISLVAANRVIVFDASWNPTHDVQSIFRVYRFGQKKTCFIYRFLAAATMEEKIYRRQVTKLSLAHRILDEHQIERHYSMGNLQELYTYDPIPKNEWKVPKIPKDDLFAEILATSRNLIVDYHEHDSLLENKEEEELTEEDRRAAWEDYEKEKMSQEFHAALLNEAGVSPFLMNSGDPKVMHGHPQEFAPLGHYQNATTGENEDQMCKIVDVRTLLGEGGSERGRWLGLRGFDEEWLEDYCRKIDETIKSRLNSVS